MSLITSQSPHHLNTITFEGWDFNIWIEGDGEGHIQTIAAEYRETMRNSAEPRGYS